ncbi:2'-5' RNA ligase superfamily protein [Sphingobium faniae]|nr:2'-5' RNA ligase superfamily protein [Sphingobium faniae]
MTSHPSAPIIVTAVMGSGDFAWLDRQRRAYYPADRNILPAHLTLFRHLPPSAFDEVAARIKTRCASPPPRASLAGILLLERGVAYRVESPALMDIWSELADAFFDLLLPQDLARPRLHVTIQNKVTAKEARALAGQLKAVFRLRPLAIMGLAAWRYRNGPWELAAKARFRG